MKNLIVASNLYICYVCVCSSSIERTKPGKYICNECLKIWEGGKFYSRSLLESAQEVDNPPPVPLQAPGAPVEAR